MASDGLSLYPLQWILSEAEKAGLVQGFQMHVRGRTLMSDIREVVFPFNPVNVSGGFEPETMQYINALDMGFIRTLNGIELKMWDMRPSHKEKQYLLRINVATFLVSNIAYEEAPRHVFEDDRLIGYRRDGMHVPAIGAGNDANIQAQQPSARLFIHLYTCYPTITLTFVLAKDWVASTSNWSAVEQNTASI